MNRPLHTLTAFLVLLTFLPSLPALHPSTLNLPPLQEPSPTPTTASLPSPADIINAVNAFRLANGLNALLVHPVLMQVAAQQANALAASEGAVGHERPCGMTLGQQLLSLGFPLWGDLSLDGYRSENWVAAATVEQAMTFWQSDAEHLDTMTDPNRSHIGAAVAVSDQIYMVLETALATNSGQHQSTAYDILTAIPLTQTLCAGFASGEISNYIIPITLSTARPDGDVIHEVQYGQTLWSLAEAYHVSVEQIKRLNGLVDDTILPGWKLLIQKSATQPSSFSTTTPPPSPSETPYPTAAPYHTAAPSHTPTIPVVPLSEQIRQNSTVVAGLLIAFSVLLAGIIGFGKRKEGT